jgi:hypothetical protein
MPVLDEQVGKSQELKVLRFHSLPAGFIAAVLTTCD